MRQTTIDIGAMPDRVQLAEQVRSTRVPCVPRHDNDDVAVLIPAPARTRRRIGRTLSQSDLDTFLSPAGGWHDMETDNR